MTVSIRASLLFSAFAMAALTAAFANPPSENAGEKSGSKHWSYGGEEGPDHWSELSAENAPCSTGVQQSPIDLSRALIATIDTPHPKWIPVRDGTVVNNGHTIQVDLGNAGGIKLNGVDYSLKQFHFHHPSEHTIDGKAFPLELHLVHASADGKLAVIGVMFQTGPASEALDSIWATAPGREGKAAVAFEIDASKFMPKSGSAYRYEGSLTTPPCSETVSWTVMAEPQTASAAQIVAFGEIFPWNARPIQPLNRRYVLRTP
jgi:carbonic anhydrase